MKNHHSKMGLAMVPIIAFALTIGTISCNKNLQDDLLKTSRVPLSTENATLIAPGIDITTFGAVADGKTDNYNAFVAAAAYASSHDNTTINFPAGTFYIAKYRSIKNDPIQDINWANCKGLKLIGVAGTKISVNGNFFRPFDYSVGTAKKSYTSGLSPFYFFHCNDLEIRNMEITGNVQSTTRAPGIDDNNPSVTESNNILLRFEMCNNVVVDNMYLHHAESDGIMVSGDRINNVWTNSTNFTMTNVKSFNNGRLGMSAGGLSGGYFKNCEFKNNGFTDGAYGHNDPAAGVDIEPGEFHNVDNIKFEGCAFENSYGNNFACTAPNTTSNITLLKCSVVTVTETSKPQGITILAKNTLIDGCIIKLKARVMKFTNPLKPGSTIKILNSLIETSGNCWTTNSTDMKDSVLVSGNQFNYTQNVMTKNVMSLQMANLRFLNNKIFIPAAALKSRPTGTHALVQNAVISQGNSFYSEVSTVKPKVSYTGTKVVADL